MDNVNRSLRNGVIPITFNVVKYIILKIQRIHVIENVCINKRNKLSGVFNVNFSQLVSEHRGMPVRDLH